MHKKWNSAVIAFSFSVNSEQASVIFILDRNHIQSLSLVIERSHVIRHSIEKIIVDFAFGCLIHDAHCNLKVLYSCNGKI